jgi:hypothetical protein
VQAAPNRHDGFVTDGSVSEYAERADDHPCEHDAGFVEEHQS